MTEFYGGRLPENKAKPRLKLAPLLTTLQFPENKDWYSAVSDWPMYLNDQMGDCTCATAGHIIEQATTYGQKNTVKITDNDVLKAYVDNSGFNPDTGANDNGAVVQDVLNYWRKTGIGGHKILAFARVDESNLDEVRAAINLFGTVYLGINFPKSAMQQFDAGEPWHPVSGSSIAGGHAINAVYYDISDGMYKIVTWGKVQRMTQAFWDAYVEEAWVVISPEWLDANNKNPDGIDMSTLGEQFTQITGEPSPFPKVPAPVTEDPDKVLEDFVRGWLGSGRRYYPLLQKALRNWLATRS
jgi:hypothetical protein